MKETFTISLSILILVAPYIAGVSIFTNNGQIYCDGLLCPVNSVSCSVSKITFGDLTNYKYIRACFDSSGFTTANEEHILPNPNPGAQINMISTVGAGGTYISNSDTLSDAQREAIEETIRDQQRYWSQWSEDFTENLRENLQKSFPKGFPFN